MTDMTQPGMTAVVASISANPYFSRFRGMPVGQELEVNDAMALFSCFEERHVNKGEILYEAGTQSERMMYLLLEGSVSVRDASGNIYSTLKAGDVFGLFSFLEERPHSATVVTQSDSAVLTLKRAYFDLITIEDPILGNRLLRFMFRLLSRTSLKLEVEYAALRDFALGFHF